MAALIISSGASASIHKHALANSGDRILEYQNWIQLVFNKVGGPASIHKQLWHKQLWFEGHCPACCIAVMRRQAPGAARAALCCR